MRSSLGDLLILRCRLCLYLEVVHGFAQGFAGLEMGNALGGNLHGFARAGISSNAGLAVVDGKAAKAANFDTVATHKGVADGIQNGLDGLLGIKPMLSILSAHSLLW